MCSRSVKCCGRCFQVGGCCRFGLEKARLRPGKTVSIRHGRDAARERPYFARFGCGTRGGLLTRCWQIARACGRSSEPAAIRECPTRWREHYAVHGVRPERVQGAMAQGKVSIVANPRKRGVTVLPQTHSILQQSNQITVRAFSCENCGHVALFHFPIVARFRPGRVERRQVVLPRRRGRLRSRCHSVGTRSRFCGRSTPSRRLH